MHVHALGLWVDRDVLAGQEAEGNPCAQLAYVQNCELTAGAQQVQQKRSEKQRGQPGLGLAGACSATAHTKCFGCGAVQLGLELELHALASFDPHDRAAQQDEWHARAQSCSHTLGFVAGHKTTCGFEWQLARCVGLAVAPVIEALAAGLTAAASFAHTDLRQEQDLGFHELG